MVQQKYNFYPEVRTSRGNEYVKQQGPYMYRGSKRFRGVGFNTYDLVQGNYTEAQYMRYFTRLKELYVPAVRFWCYSKTGPATNDPGYFRYLSGNQLVYREATFKTLDLAAYCAAKVGIMLSPTLADNWPENNNWGHKQEYCYWNNTINGTSLDRYTNGDGFFFNSQVNDIFKDFLYTVLNRRNTYTGVKYKNDPNILRWELINEPRYTTGTDTNSNTVNSYRLNQLNSWFTIMSNFIRANDPNHMISTGSVAQFLSYTADDPIHNGTFYGNDFVEQHKTANINNADFHIYPYEDYDAVDRPTPSLRAFGQSMGYSGVTSAGFKAQIAEYCSKAHAIQRPVFMGEEGVDKRVTYASEFPAYPRVEHDTQLFREFFDVNDGDFIFKWHGGTADVFGDDNNYNVKLDGPHTGDNDPGNLNTSDASLLELIKNRNMSLS